MSSDLVINGYGYSNPDSGPLEVLNITENGTPDIPFVFLLTTESSGSSLAGFVGLMDLSAVGEYQGMVGTGVLDITSSPVTTTPELSSGALMLAVTVTALLFVIRRRLV